MSKKNKEKPAKKLMEHKPLTIWVSSTKSAKAAAPLPPTPTGETEPSHEETLAFRTERRTIDSLLLQLPHATVDPERMADEIFERIRRLKGLVDAETKRQIEERCVAAHVKLIGTRYDSFSQYPKPAKPFGDIQESVRILTVRGQADLAFKALGVADRAEFDAKVNAAHTAALKHIEDKNLQPNIDNAKRYLSLLTSGNPGEPDTTHQRLLAALKLLGDKQDRAFPPGIKTQDDRDRFIQAAYDRAKLDKQVTEAQMHLQYLRTAGDPDARLKKLREALALLGDNQNRVFPPGINTQDDRDRFIQAAYEPAKKAEAVQRVEYTRERFQNFGNDRGLSGGRNPDMELASLREEITTYLNGDVTRLARAREARPAEVIEQEIDSRHSRALNNVADWLLRQRGLRLPMLGLFGDALEKAKSRAENGYDPTRQIKDFYDENAAWGWRIDDTKRATIATIETNMVRNEVIRFALTSQHFALKGERHADMLKKTLARAEAVGGMDTLDDIKNRFKFMDPEWEALKAFVANTARVQAQAISAPVAEAPAFVEVAEGLTRKASTGESPLLAEERVPTDLATFEITPRHAGNGALAPEAGTVGAAFITTAHDVVVPPALPADAVISVEVEEPKVRRFDLNDPDVQPTIDRLASNPSVLGELMDAIMVAGDWDPRFNLRLEAVYRARTQQILEMEDPTDAANTLADHLDRATLELRDEAPELTERLQAYRHVMTDRVGAIAMKRKLAENVLLERHGPAPHLNLSVS